MGVVGHGLSNAAHGRKTPVPGQCACGPHRGRLPTRSVRSNSSRGGEIYITIHQGDLRGFSLPQHVATDIASTAHGRKTPVPGQRACCLHHGRLTTRSVRSNSSRGGGPVPGQRACCPHHGRLPNHSVRSNSRGGVGIDPLG